MLRKLHVRFGKSLLIILVNWGCTLRQTRTWLATFILPTGEPVREFESHRFRHIYVQDRPPISINTRFPYWEQASHCPAASKYGWLKPDIK
jgi:hypothetical protein